MTTLTCPHCNQPFEAMEDLAGRRIHCPNCGQSLAVPNSVAALVPQAQVVAQAHVVAQAQGPLNPASLRDPKEGTAFGWLVAFSIMLWIFLVIGIISSRGGLLLIIGFVALMQRFAQLFAAAYIKTNAVEVSDRQFPEIQNLASAFAQRLEQPLPTIYVMQDSVWNAFATKLAGKRMVVLFSGAVDSLLLKGSMTQIAWLVGHELGHHYAGHLNFWRHTTAQLGSWAVWFGLWYRRRCELTCDRYGLACANSLQESLNAVCNMSVGAQLASKVNVEQAIAQWNQYRSEFFVRYRTMYSGHPHNLWRLEALQSAARELRISR